MRREDDWGVALLCFTLVAAALFVPLELAHRYVGDAVDQLIETLPAYLGAHELWEPRTMLGYPLAADPNQAFFYPLGLLRWIPRSFDAFAGIAYALAGIGTFGLIRSYARSTTAGLCGGCIFMLSGFMIGHAGHMSIVQPAAWVPFLFWSLAELRQSTQTRWIALGAFAIAFAALAGQPQVLTYALFFAIPYAVVSAQTGTTRPPRYAACACALFAFGVAFASIQLLPEAELFGQSVRASFSFDRFQEFAIPVLQVPIRLFFPYVFGYTSSPPYRSGDLNVGSFAEMSLYVGVTTLILALAAIRLRPRDPIVRYWTIAGCAALALTTGNQLALGWLTYRIPVYNLFRAPGRLSCEIALAAAVLAGIAIANVEPGASAARLVASCAKRVGIAFAATFVLADALSIVPPDVFHLLVSGYGSYVCDPLRNAAVGIPIAVFALGAIGLRVWAREKRPVTRAAIVLGIVLLDLASFVPFAYWNFGSFDDRPLAPPAYVGVLRAKLARSAQRVLTLPQGERYDSGIAPNLNILWDVASLRGYTPLPLARTTALFDSDWAAPVASVSGRNNRTLDIAAVRYVVVPPGARAQGVPLMHDREHWRSVGDGAATTILENRRALPRAWTVHRTIVASRTVALDAIRRGTFDPRTTALVEDDAMLAKPSAGAAGRDRVRFIGFEPTALRLAVACDRACLVVTSDATYPGWTASVDGRETRIYPVDVALRGIALTAGRHDVRFAYRSAPLENGVALAAVAAFLLAVLAFARHFEIVQFVLNRRRRFGLPAYAARAVRDDA